MELSHVTYTMLNPVAVALGVDDIVLLVVVVVVFDVGVMVLTVSGGSAAQMRNVDLAALVLVDRLTPKPPSQLQYVLALVVARSHDVAEIAVAVLVLEVVEVTATDGVVAEAWKVVPLMRIGSQDV